MCRQSVCPSASLHFQKESRSRTSAWTPGLLHGQPLGLTGSLVAAAAVIPLELRVGVGLLWHVRLETALGELLFEVLADEGLLVRVLNLVHGRVLDPLAVAGLAGRVHGQVAP